MNSYPVDTEQFMAHVIGPIGIDPVLHPRTDAQVTNKSGVLMWKLIVLYKQPHQRHELVTIRFPADQKPPCSPDTTFEIHGLTVGYGEPVESFENNGYYLVMTAERIEFTPTPALT